MPASTASSATRSGGERRLLGRLQHHAIAGRQRGREFPRRHQEGKIPRHHGAHHAQRLARDQGERGLGRRRDLVIDLVDGFAVPAHAFGHRAHIAVARVRNRLSHVERFEQRELVGVFLDQLGELHQDALARFGRLIRPQAGFERRTRRFHRAVDVLGIPRCDPRQEAPIDGGDIVEGLAAGGRNKAPADEGSCRES